MSDEQEYVHDGYRPCDACIGADGLPTGTTKPGGLHLLTCLRCGGHGKIPTYRKIHPHLVNGEFQSDKYPTCPRGKVPLSVKDASAQDLLWEYAQRRRAVDAQFSADLEIALRSAGFAAPSPETGTAAVPTCEGCLLSEVSYGDGPPLLGRHKATCSAYDPGPAPEPVKHRCAALRGEPGERDRDACDIEQEGNVRCAPGRCAMAVPAAEPGKPTLLDDEAFEAPSLQDLDDRDGGDR